jgi:hypothetical protein
MKATRSGVSFADTTNSVEAGWRAAEEAMANASIERSDFTLAFCGGNHDPINFLKAVREVVGDAALIGGTSVGVITNGKSGYGGYEAGVAVVASERVRFDPVSVGGLEKSEEAAGARLGEMVSERSSDDAKAMLLFYDSVKQPNPLKLNVASQLIHGVETGLHGRHIPVFGGGMIKDYQWSGSHVFEGDQATTQHAVGVLVSGDCSVHHTISHGCEPASDYHTKELDGRPALDVIENIIGTGASRDWQQYSLLITLGANYGSDPYGDFHEDEYVNRLIAGVNQESGSVLLFESDFAPGDRVQVMRRSNEKMLASARTVSTDLLNSLDGSRPFLGVYVDCAGRTSGFCGAGEEEGAAIQETIGSRMPLLGFYSGVEIAPFMGGPRALDWTGVLLVLAEEW